MTGIAGFHDWKRDVREQKQTLLQMTRELSHRRIGSDETMEFVDSNLSLTAGVLWNANGVALAVEGYLYNSNEIGKELLSAGFHLETVGLAELIQKSYLHWGDSFVERLFGAFAFVLWDSREQKLLLGRDQLGLKPLYYADCEGVVAFGSEIKAVLEHPLVTRTVDAVGLSEMLVKGPYFTPGQALFRDVHEVIPGHIVRFTPNGKKDITYWKVESYRHEDSFEETIVKLRDMLEGNVVQLKNRGLSDTAILSGGLDSSGLIAMLCQEPGSAYKTFSGNTPESHEGPQEERDAPWVKRVADFLGITNEEALVDSASILESNDRPRRANDLPTLAKYETMIYLVFRKIRERQHTSVMVGETADEMFGSLKWFYDRTIMDQPTFPWHNSDNSILASGDLLQKIRAEEYVKDLYQDYLRQVPRLADDTPEEARRREFFYLTLKDYMPTILRRNERLAQSLNMEVSMPFCDPRIAQYIWNLPWEMKNYAGRKKGILRETFRAVLPDDVVYREKSLAPIVFNTDYSDYLHGEYNRLLQDPNAPLNDLVDRDKIRQIMDSKKIYQDRSIRWRFDYYLQIDHWLREYKVVLR